MNHGLTDTMRPPHRPIISPLLRLFPLLLGVGGLLSSCTSVDPDDGSTASFIKAIGGENDEDASAVEQTTDGGYIICGTTQSEGFGKRDLYLVKTDATGRQEWAKTYGGAENDEGRSVRQTTDGGFIVAGFTASDAIGSNDIYLLRLDGEGDTLWTRRLGGSNDDRGFVVRQARDGSFLLGGYTKSGSCGGADYYLARFDANGAEIWSKTFGGFGEEMCHDLVEMENGEIVAIGISGSSIGIDRLSADGVLLTRGTHPATIVFNSFAHAIVPAPDGSVMLAGYNQRGGTGGIDSLIIVKVDTSRWDDQWVRSFGMPGGNRAYAIQSTPDGGTVAFGFTRAFNGGRPDFILVKIDADGNEVFTHTYGGNGSDEGRSLHQTADGGFIMVGPSDSFADGRNGDDILLIKVGPNGEM